ncbi:hypothetical protein TUZN_0424 [Thermoproteus uzoniensis 768-20]|uniref:Uncharacterized protein n=1 Tax=Thermoproteus uzoniensis (strain 768-20) TaxID=999630 RepID=F2L2Y2_THEU7|nr:hypothetical protein [Thermoproteus uzoniensis]AEA11920.1 hypothetical protein TUZN_0424 [Thermoproteus uzoniensis 768-20]
MDEALRAKLDTLVRSAAAPVIDKISKNKKVSADELLIASLYLISAKLDDIRNSLDELARGIQRLNELPPVIKQNHLDVMTKLGEVLEELKKMQTFGIEET